MVHQVAWLSGRAKKVSAGVKSHLQLRALRQALEERNAKLGREVARRRAAERQLEESLDQAILVAQRGGQIQFCTRRGWDLLSRFFHLSSDGSLPEVILEWIDEGTAHPLQVVRPEGVWLSDTSWSLGGRLIPACCGSMSSWR